MALWHKLKVFIENGTYLKLFFSKIGLLPILEKNSFKYVVYRNVYRNGIEIKVFGPFS